MNIPLGPSFETIAADLVAPKQQPLLPGLQEESGPHEPDDVKVISEQSTTRRFERACMIGAIVLVVLAALVFIL